MRIVNDRVSVRVPASALLFHSDCTSIALALDLWNEISATLTTGNSKALILGSGQKTLPKDATHPIIAVICKTLEKLGQPTAGVELVCRNNILRRCGLGELEADVLAGILLVKAFCGEPPEFTEKLICELAAEFSVHAGRFAALLRGGAVLAWQGQIPDLQAQVQGENNLPQTGADFPLQSAKFSQLALPPQLEMNLLTCLENPVQRANLSELSALSTLSELSAQPPRNYLPATIAPLLLHACTTAAFSLREVAQIGAQLAQKYADTSLLSEPAAALFLDLQKAGWPVLSVSAEFATAAAVLIFAQIPAQMQNTLTGAGFRITATVPAQSAIVQ